jgi:hypothetical protein
MKIINCEFIFKLVQIDNEQSQSTMITRNRQLDLFKNSLFRYKIDNILKLLQEKLRLFEESIRKFELTYIAKIKEQFKEDSNEKVKIN